MKHLTKIQYNSLPKYIKDYIRQLETDADPSGTLRENFYLKIIVDELMFECQRMISERGGPRTQFRS